MLNLVVHIVTTGLQRPHPVLYCPTPCVAVYVLQWPPNARVAKSSSAVSEPVTCDVTQTLLPWPLHFFRGSPPAGRISVVLFLSVINISQRPSTKHIVNKRAQHKPECLDRVSAHWNKIAFLGGFHDISFALLPLLLGTV